ncbi:MAG: YitT family protein [Eubacterium sp.]|nr:YitT family protein [Eubacterium sp.]
MKHKERIHCKKMIMLTIAGTINAIGITIFLNPVNLYDSGISGTSMLIAQVTPDSISLSLCLLLLNIPLFLYGFKKQGGIFTFYAIYTVCIYSIVAWLITDVLPVDVSIASPLAGTDLLLCALFGGLISGIGSGLAIRSGGGYSNSSKTVVYFVVNRFQVTKMKDIVREITV